MHLNAYLMAAATAFQSALFEASPGNEDNTLVISSPFDTSSIASSIDFCAETSFEHVISTTYSQVEEQKPKTKAFVVWHGLGDNYESNGINNTIRIIKNVIPDAFVHSVYLHPDPKKDERFSVLGFANSQVDAVCEQLSNITELQNGFSAIGFSQGGLFLRAIVERCPNVTMNTLVTFGLPHMGVLELPLCPNLNDWICKRRNSFLKRQVWNALVQKTVIPAQYFRDPAQYDKYLEYSQFLADLNNERKDNVSAIARDRFLSLEKLVLIKFSEDTTLVPKESAFFEELDPVSGTIIPFDKTRFYTNDLVGLQLLHEKNKIDFYTVSDVHMRFLKEFLRQIVETYFA